MEKATSIPRIGSKLRKNILRMPEAVFQASGIVINGRRIKSCVFTTDLAIIRNCDADAVFAVYAAAGDKRRNNQGLLHTRFLRGRRRNNTGAAHGFAGKGR